MFSPPLTVRFRATIDVMVDAISESHSSRSSGMEEMKQQRGIRLFFDTGIVLL